MRWLLSILMLASLSILVANPLPANDLRRYGGKNPFENDLVDDLELTYSGNQLQNVTDAATDFPYSESLDFRARKHTIFTPGDKIATVFDRYDGIVADSLVLEPYIPFNSTDFSYDANGNVCRDFHSGISSISYNPLNLPQKVNYSDEEIIAARLPLVTQISYTYDALGKKHSVNECRKLGNRILSQGDKISYIGDYIVVNDTIDRLMTPYGYLRNGVFHTYLRDYQQNIVCVVTPDDVIQTNIYYPDGLTTSNSTGVAANTFKHTGKELLLGHGLPRYDFTARFTQPSTGNHFRSIDPNAETYTKLSPYTFCAGDPINNTDPSGRDVFILYYSEWACHLAMLIQNNEGKWQYYSINGTKSYYSWGSSGSGSLNGSSSGLSHDDVGVGNWDSPEEFLNSDYNSEGDKEDPNINHYGYNQGLYIPTSQEQDQQMSEDFRTLSEKTKYNVFNNNCATAVQLVLHNAKIPITRTARNNPDNMHRIEINQNMKRDKSYKELQFLPYCAYTSIRQNTLNRRTIWRKGKGR
ncbi:MAG: hypothetical protein NC098_04810 [Lachnoclostridium sp.]|nr:hypothetical protein [Lachnoclostridium sp.]